MGKMIGAAEFKATCLKVIDDMQRDRQPVTITKRGKPVAELKPVEEKKRKFTFGCMKGSVLKYDRPFDPAIDPLEWDANR